MFQGCLMKVSWERKFHGCFKSFSKKFQENVSGVSKKVSCCMALIAASRAEGGLVYIMAIQSNGFDLVLGGVSILRS